MTHIPMNPGPFPVIDLEATGRNILRLRKDRGLSVRDVQNYFGFEAPRAIYLWQKGQCLPSVDNLYALSVLLDAPMNEILVPTRAAEPRQQKSEQQAEACCSGFFRGLGPLHGGEFRLSGTRRRRETALPIRFLRHTRAPGEARIEGPERACLQRGPKAPQYCPHGDVRTDREGWQDGVDAGRRASGDGGSV